MSTDDTGDTDPELPPTRQLSWIPLGGAFAIVAVIVILTLVLGGGENRGAPSPPRVDAKGALLCPNNYEYDPATRYWVPNDPIGVDAGTSLVPDEPPARVTLCRFETLGDRTAPALLASRGREVLGGDLDKVRATLIATKVSRRAADGRRDLAAQPVYLVGLIYTNGTLWVSVGALSDGNGEIVATEELATTVAAAYRAQRWP